MAENTKIEWATHTFNPWVGCTKVSPACDHCYAEGWAKRSGMVQWGAGAERRRTTPANWRMPEKWNRQARIQHDAWEGFKTTNPGLTDEQLQAQGFIKPQRPRVFCSSLADVFDNAVPTEWRYDLFNLILSTPHLDWLLLTKRIGNAEKMIEDTLPDNMKAMPSEHPLAWSWPHVWIGATICNQEEADRDIPKLLSTPAAKRFLSMEPLLGAVDLSQWLDIIQYEDGAPWMRRNIGHLHDMLDWVIVGGESGADARPMHTAWAQALRDQCHAAGVPFLFKQWGEWREPLDGEEFDTSMGRAAKPPAFILSETGTVHCFESAHIVNGKAVIKVGKKTAGRLLDGREWNEVPAC